MIIEYVSVELFLKTGVIVYRKAGKNRLVVIEGLKYRFGIMNLDASSMMPILLIKEWVKTLYVN